MVKNNSTDIYNKSLEYHAQKPFPGKIGTLVTKPMATANDLSLAYTPGVAGVSLAIKDNPDNAYKYTAKSNLVAVITNGTAVLGLGNIGPLAAKPVMEGKSALMKTLANVDSIDIEIDSTNEEEFVKIVSAISIGFGGINLEDIKAPECFFIETALQQMLNIPVFHDDQHGTAIVVLAGLINACHLVNKQLDKINVLINGAGAAGIACARFLNYVGLSKKKIKLCDTGGLITTSRFGLNSAKLEFAQDFNENNKSMEDLMDDVDVFIGLSVENALSASALKRMATNPIVFALANPIPEIMPDLAKETRPDCIIATGRSDFPNQVNNVASFPYIFRAALDSRAKLINYEMKLAAAKAIASIALSPVGEETVQRTIGKRSQILPNPLDPRLALTVPVAVYEAAITSGASTNAEMSVEEYRQKLISILGR